MPLIQYSDENQVGRGFRGELFQKGYGRASPPFQRGSGLGSLVSKIKVSPFLSKFKRKIQFVAKPLLNKVIAKTKPYAKQLGKKIAKSAIDVGKESIRDIVINKKSPKEVVKNKGQELKRKVIEAASDSLKLMEGKGYSSQVKRAKTILKHKSIKSRKQKKEIQKTKIEKDKNGKGKPRNKDKNKGKNSWGRASSAIKKKQVRDNLS